MIGSTTLSALLDTLQNANRFDDLQAAVEQVRDLFEVEHAVYHAVRSDGGQYAALTYPETWVRRYIAEGYRNIDPVVQGLARGGMPVDWKRLDWGTPARRALLREAIDAGLGNQGYSTPIRDRNGNFAVFTLNGRETDSKWMRITASKGALAALLAHALHHAAARIEQPMDPAPERPALSPRERDVLTLLCLGQSRGRVAETLRISEHTLRAYIDSARLKLGAANTTHAVALALSRRLILL